MNFIVTCSFLHVQLTKPFDFDSSAHLSLIHTSVKDRIADAKPSIFQLMGSTRGTLNGFGDSGGEPSQLLPPPTHLVDVVAIHTELLRQLV